MEAGLNGLRVGMILNEPGKWGERDYKTESHYLTATFFAPESPTSKAGAFSKPALEKVAAAVRSDSHSAEQKKDHQEKQFADMPISVTSFGAARIGNSIYVYGGHTGEAHHYSNEEQSNQLLVLDISQPNSEWKQLSVGRPLQGLALVAYRDQLIRIGGLEALNKLDEDHDLRSTNEVFAFHLPTGDWRALPLLPECRSSHDAIVVGNRLFVVGGWSINGEQTQWLSTAWMLNLDDVSAGWQPISTPPFQRRALALAHLGNRIYAIGGMNEQGGPTTEVASFDIDSKKWAIEPKLLGRPMNGFGASVWDVGKSLIATTIDGDIQKLTEGASSWEVIGKTRNARFFHRLLPFTERQLLAVGGANMSEGKYPNVEIISVP